MSDPGPTTVGSINAKLVLDVDDFMRRSEEAQAEADKLDGRKVEITADADTARAQAQLSALAVAENKVRIAQLDLDAVNQRSDATTQQKLRAENALATAQQQLAKVTEQSAQSASKETVEVDKNTDSHKKNTDAKRSEFSAMQALIGASPALLAGTATIGAATVGLGVAFGGMALAGVSAIYGIKQEMASGTQVGMVYSRGVDDLGKAWQGLSHISAVQMVNSFDTAIQNVNQHMPLLAGITRDASSALGNMGQTLVSGLMRSLVEMRPLIDAGLVGIQNLVHWISSVPASGGFQQFVKYAIDNLPATINLVENLVGAVIHLTTSVAPMGPVVIGVLNGVTMAIQAIPAPVLGTITTLALGAFGAFKLWGGLAPIIQSVGSAISFAATRVEIAIPVVGILTAGITLLAQVMGDSAQSTKNAAAATDDYTQSIMADNDALGQHTKQQVIDNLAKTDAISIGKQAGLTAADLANAILDGGAAAQYVTTRIQAHTQALGNAGAESLEWANKSRILYDILGTTTGRIQEQEQATKENADAKAMAAAADTTQAMYLDQLAAGLGSTTQALNMARSSQTDVGAQTAQTTLQMQLQNNAAGLLKQGLDALNTGALTLAQSETATWAAINTATDALKNNKAVIEGHSAAAVADQQALQGVASGAQAQAEKVAESTGSTQQAIKTYTDAKAALENQLRSQGLLTGAVQDYINKIFDVNNLKVKPTVLEVQNQQALAAIAEMQAQLASLPSTRVINVVTHNSTVNDGTGQSGTGGTGGQGLMIPQSWLGGRVGYLASGGSVRHPFARGTDTEPYMLSRGEFVVNTASTNAIERDHPGAMDYMNRTGKLPQSGGGMGPVYLTAYFQNPITGDEVQATVRAVARDEVGGALREMTLRRPRG
jgi:hypothetical protein